MIKYDDLKKKIEEEKIDDFTFNAGVAKEFNENEIKTIEDQ